MKYYIVEYENGESEIIDDNFDFVKRCKNVVEAIKWCADDEYEVVYPVGDGT